MKNFRVNKLKIKRNNIFVQIVRCNPTPQKTVRFQSFADVTYDFRNVIVDYTRALKETISVKMTCFVLLVVIRLDHGVCTFNIPVFCYIFRFPVRS